MDIVSRAVRSKMMAAVRQRHTAPDLLVRKQLHALGLRFRLHDRKLPGSPDIVLQRWKTVIFVHGCFWHRHGCARTTSPTTRREFWLQKFQANVARDRSRATALRRRGWKVLLVWECWTRDLPKLRQRLAREFQTARDAQIQNSKKK